MNLREATKREWGTIGERPTIEELHTGALLRLADSSELIANNYRHLLEERDMYERWWKEERNRVARLERSLSAMRGVVTKLKGKAAP